MKELSALFPSDAQGVVRFFQDVEKNLSTHPVPDAGQPFPLAAEYLHGIIKDWRLRRILGSLGTQEPYSNLSLLAAQWNLMIKEGIWYPQGGTGSFCDRLVRAVTGKTKIRGDEAGGRGCKDQGRTWGPQESASKTERNSPPLRSSRMVTTRRPLFNYWILKRFLQHGAVP